MIGYSNSLCLAVWLSVSLSDIIRSRLEIGRFFLPTRDGMPQADSACSCFCPRLLASTAATTLFLSGQQPFSITYLLKNYNSYKLPGEHRDAIDLFCLPLSLVKMRLFEDGDQANPAVELSN